MTQFSGRAFVIGLAAIVGCVLGALLWPESRIIILLVVIVFAIAYGVAIVALRPRPDYSATPPAPDDPPPDGQLPWPDRRAPQPSGPPETMPWPEVRNHAHLPAPASPPELPPAQTELVPRPLHWWLPSQSPAQRATPPIRPAIRFDPRHARIAQCPACGGFDLAAGRDESGYQFGCYSCENLWQWAPGRPWPDVRTDPTRRETADRVDFDYQPDATDDQHLR